jgi:hypothetical protein
VSTRSLRLLIRGEPEVFRGDGLRRGVQMVGRKRSMCRS